MPDRWGNSGSYGMNGRMGGEDNFQDYGVQRQFLAYVDPLRVNEGLKAMHFNIHRTVKPSDMYLVADSPDFCAYILWGSSAAAKIIDCRHENRCNMLFHDGHVARIHITDLQVESYRILPWFNRQ